MPIETHQEKIQIFSSDSSPPRKRNHQWLAITQDLIHWLRTEGCKEGLNDKELLAELQRLRFVYYDPDSRADRILFYITKGILAGPKKSKMGYCYQIPSKGNFKVRAYFSQKDPRNPDQEIAPKLENLTASDFYQDWSEIAKKTVLYLGVAITDDRSEIRGLFSIENGRIELQGITFQGLLRALPNK